jgi:hypothetical protein
MSNDTYVKELEATVERLQKELADAHEQLSKLHCTQSPPNADSEYGEVSFHGKKYRFAKRPEGYLPSNGLWDNIRKP